MTAALVFRVSAALAVAVSLGLAHLSAQSPAPPVRLDPDKPPRKIKNVTAEYPEEARAARIEGDVRLDLTIGTDGKVEDVRVLDSIPLLDAAAVTAARQWEFEPVLVDGARVRGTLTRSIRFPSGRDTRVTLRDALTALEKPTETASATAAPQSDVQFDAKGANFTPWVRQFIAKVRRNWMVPLAAATFRDSVVVSMRIHRDGAIDSVAIEKPSSVETLNRASYAAIVQSSPVEPLPSDYPDPTLKMTVTFHYNDAPPARTPVVPNSGTEQK